MSNYRTACSWIQNQTITVKAEVWKAAAMKKKIMQKVLLIMPPTIGVTPQKECIPDAHCVVNIQIKLQITKEWRP